MCGIAGFLGDGPWSQNDAAGSVLRRMADAIKARGPDDWGVWHDAKVIGLAHRRLSILDLSSAGHQPMVSDDGRYVISFNGEIYNHLDLRRELNNQSTGVAWRGRSDTETLLGGFVQWGIKATIERCIGMFAFAVWDKRERVLTLGRDRLGEKPLYYGWQGSGGNACFLFGSELKALRAHPAFSAEIDRDALGLLMRHGYIPAPHSIYQGIYKLQPGTLLSVSPERRESAVTTYWSLAEVACGANNMKFRGAPEQLIDDLELLLKSAVRQQMLADVPLGAFLSGGVDSSAVVALMQSQADRPVKTFSIGFNEAGYDEALHAKAVSHVLGTDHTELYVTAQQALDVIPILPSLYCEPFADSSQVPTFLVSRLARSKVTVSLSGDGGDELFAGYSRYVSARNLWGVVSRAPPFMRAIAAGGIRSLSPAVWGQLLRPVQQFGPERFRQVNFGAKLHKIAHVLPAETIEDFYRGLLMQWQPEDIVVGGRNPLRCYSQDPSHLSGLDDVQKMMAVDTVTYLPDDVLVKVDRAAMSVSLESRVPFLDHRVVEFAWRVPQTMKLRDGDSKWILRQVLYRYVPKALVDRPKMGFGVPIACWLRGALRDWAESLLDESRLRKEGFFHPAPIRQKWSEYLSGNYNWQTPLWSVLMFQAWLEAQES